VLAWVSRGGKEREERAAEEEEHSVWWLGFFIFFILITRVREWVPDNWIRLHTRPILIGNGLHNPRSNKRNSHLRKNQIVSAKFQ